MRTNEIKVTDRIKFLDGLRGVAVLLVMFFHFYYQQISEAGRIVVSPVILQDVFRFGNMGVYIFFVLSGFIISYITYGKVESPRYIFRFIVRRQIRLDPPFWLTVILGTILAYVSVRVLRNEVYLPNTADIFANLAYIFTILDRYDIIRVGWTLCLEIQFYLVYILIVFLFSKYNISKRFQNLIYFSLFCLSLIVSAYGGKAFSPYIINYWYVFFLGVGITLYIKGDLDLISYLLLVISPYLLYFAPGSLSPIYFSTGTALLIFFAFRWNQENRWLSGTFFQFFGMISYSLYLIHCLVGNKLIRVLKRAMDWSPDNVSLTGLILLISITVSVIFAFVLYHSIERTSIVLSRKLTQ